VERVITCINCEHVELKEQQEARLNQSLSLSLALALARLQASEQVASHKTSKRTTRTFARIEEKRDSSAILFFEGS
jgi:hypothetical protein